MFTCEHQCPINHLTTQPILFDRGKPVLFKLGTDRVVKGWNIGVAGMKSGGKRRLMVPSALGYGATGAGDVIPPNADLIFDIELIEVK